MQMFPDNATAEAWFAKQRWGVEPTCPHCGCTNVQVEAKHPTTPYRCRNKKCRKFFSVRVGTVMQDAKLDYQTWAMPIYTLNVGIKGASSMKIHRDLDETKRTVRYLAHRIRELGTLDQMRDIAKGMFDKQITHTRLNCNTGLGSTAK